METLDVRPIPRKVRHDTVLERLAGLATGEALRLVNDHDPRPLRHQLDSTRPGQFAWAYVETGPETWSVDITSRARVVDARPIVASGGDPLAAVLAAAALVGAGEVLVVHTPSDPAPLRSALRDQGFSHLIDKVDGAWRVTFARR